MFNIDSPVYQGISHALDNEAVSLGMRCLYERMFYDRWWWDYPKDKPQDFDEFVGSTIKKGEVPEWASIQAVRLYFQEMLKESYKQYVETWEQKMAEKEHPEE